MSKEIYRFSQFWKAKDHEWDFCLVKKFQKWQRYPNLKNVLSEVSLRKHQVSEGSQNQIYSQKQRPGLDSFLLNFWKIWISYKHTKGEHIARKSRIACLLDQHSLIG